MIQAVEPAFALSFLAGLASFLSPCVLPLVPGYLSVLTLKKGAEQDIEKSPRVFPILLFVSGFAFVFSLMGTSASFLGSLMAENRSVLSAASGAVIIVFGLFTMDLVKIPALQKTRAVRLKTGGGGLAYVFFLGCAFAVGWTPCIGPVLASILSYAAASQEAAKGVFLLLAYAAGLGAPFVLAGVFFAKWNSAASFARRYHPAYKYAVGGLMTVTGALMSLDLLFYVNIYGQRIFDLFGIDFWMKI